MELTIKKLSIKISEGNFYLPHDGDEKQMQPKRFGGFLVTE
jgi:hypothetical protein